MRTALGTAVCSGMIGVTLFGIFLTPVFYYVIGWFAEKRRKPTEEPSPTIPPSAAPATGTAH
jgi:hypothetical protein